MWPILAMVQTGSDLNDIGTQPVVNHVGEPARDHPAEISMSERPKFRREHEQVENVP